MYIISILLFFYALSTFETLNSYMNANGAATHVKYYRNRYISRHINILGASWTAYIIISMVSIFVKTVIQRHE